MTKQTREQKLIQILQDRLSEIDKVLLVEPKEEADEQFEELVNEAIKIREMLKILNDKKQ